MEFLTILGIAVGLGMDAFAVAIAVGTRLERLCARPVFRLSFHFGLFQFLMPILGWFAGSRIQYLIESFDHWVAFGLLVFIGGKMVKESRSRDDGNVSMRDPTRKWSLVLLSIATSIDALAVGLGLAVLRVEIVYPSVVIGVVAAAMTMVGMVFGRQLGRRFGKRMELLGGLILIAIGIKIVADHLWLG